MPTAPATHHPVALVPIYKTELSASEQLSIDRTVEVLVDRPLFLVGPVRLQAYMQTLGRRYGQRLQFISFDDHYFAGIKGYNALMLSADFYKRFAAYSHMLICQTDALVLSDQLDTWCDSGYSYIGAPWLEGGSQPLSPLRFSGVGNGGFSLRKVQDFLRVLDKPLRVPNFIKARDPAYHGYTRRVRYLKHEWLLAYNRRPLFPSSNEDAFWGALVPAVCPYFRVPSPEQALAFAFEVAPRWMYELNGRALPFGCHAWERFDLAFWREHLPFLKSASAGPR